MNKPNYAAFRDCIKRTNVNLNDMDESEIFRMFISVAYGQEWVNSIIDDPVIGSDNLYHMVYISVRDDGMIYFGKHSTDLMNDDYIGSGINVTESTKSGHTFTMTPLAYFLNSDMAYAMEKMVVNQEFVSTVGVLNQIEGGKSTKPDAVSAPSNVNKISLEPKKKNKSGKTTGWTFFELGLKVGDEVVCTVNGDSCKVKTGWLVDYNGKSMMLRDVLASAGVSNCSNSLYMFTHKGKLLSDIRDGK